MVRGKYDVMQVLVCGTSQEVSAKDYEIADLALMVQCAIDGNCTISISHSDELDNTAKSVIIDNGKTNVVFK